MGVRVKSKRAVREALIWTLVVIAGYVGFSHFATLYESGQRWAAQAGLLAAGEAERSRESPAAAFTAAPVPAKDLRGTIIGEALPRTRERKRQVSLEANAFGHFHVHAEVSGKPVEFMTDTGATYVALSYETAIGLGFAPRDLRFTGRSATANGMARVAAVTLDALRVGDILMRDVQAVVAEPGRMSQNLLGMSFIGRLTGFELSGTRLVMTE
jgi:aspartyl protease family protein